MPYKDYTHKNLSGKDLRHSIHTYKDLSFSDFKGSQLQGAIFDICVARHARFYQANLRGAVLDYMDLRWSSFENANLTRASLAGADLRGTNLSGANLAGANLRGATGNGVEIITVTAKYVINFVVPTQVIWVGCTPFTMAELEGSSSPLATNNYTLSQKDLLNKKRELILDLAREFFSGETYA